MSSLYSYIDASERAHLEGYVQFEEIIPRSNTGVLTINEDGDRVITDDHVTFGDYSFAEGDTIHLYTTSPASVNSPGYYTVLEIDTDDNYLVIDSEVSPKGANVSYRIIATGGLQDKINSLYRIVAASQNIDVSSAKLQEQINLPWYTEVTNIVFNYFSERRYLDDSQFAYYVTDGDIDDVTLVPRPIIADPGPLLYPYGYSNINPDRRNGDAATGLGTPSLLGLPDSGPRTANPFSPPGSITIQSDLGEEPALDAEKDFYSSYTYPYTTDQETRLQSIKDVLKDSLDIQIDSLNNLAGFLDSNLSDLQNRGLTGSSFYVSISIARRNITTALAQADFHRHDGTYGAPAITTGSAPSAQRVDYIHNTRPPEISTRVSQILTDQTEWINQRYAFLARRVNRVDGSLNLLRRANFDTTDISDRIAVYENERLAIKNILDGNK